MEGRQETFQREDATEIPSEHETQDLEVGNRVKYMPRLYIKKCC